MCVCVSTLLQRGMRETFGESSEAVRLWFKSRDSFLLSFHLSAMRSTHALARICAENTPMTGSVYVGHSTLSLPLSLSLCHSL